MYNEKETDCLTGMYSETFFKYFEKVQSEIKTEEEMFAFMVALSKNFCFIIPAIMKKAYGFSDEEILTGMDRMLGMCKKKIADNLEVMREW